jgi:hypothetical protein
VKQKPRGWKPQKWHLPREKSGNLGIKDMARESEGQPVNLEGLGTFRVPVTSAGTATPEELNAAAAKRGG